MQYTLTPTDDPRWALRHHVGLLLDEARALLDTVDAGDPERRQDAIHEVRKRCKETRAVVRLLGVPGKQRRRFDAIVAEAARQLAGTRERQVMRDTLDGLAPDLTGRGRDDAVAALLHTAPGDDPVLPTSAAAAALDEASEILARWMTADEHGATGHRASGREQVAAELEASYRLGRQRWKALGDDSGDGDEVKVHEWRKAVKRLWYQARVVRGVAPNLFDPLEHQLDELGQLLGDDHDLAVLIAALEQASDGRRQRRQLAGAITAARRRQRKLRKRALRLGERAFTERPKLFAKRLARAWDDAARAPQHSER
jgi:CHAD domain-containing protein